MNIRTSTCQNQNWKRIVRVLFFALLSSRLAAESSPPVALLFRAGINATEGQGIAVGSNGVIYATGQFVSTATFGSTTLTNGGAEDYWLAAYSPTGGTLWAVRAGGTGSDFGSDVIVDRSGNVVVAGVIQGTNDFHGVTNAAGFGKKDWFIAKYSPAGALVWVRLVGSPDNDQAFDVAEDDMGNYIVSGRIGGVANFGTTNIGAAGQIRCALAKFDSNGQTIWARDLGSTDSTATTGAAADGNGNAYIVGLATSPAGPFVAKYNSVGDQLWRKSMSAKYYFDEASGVAVDGVGNVYVAGRFSTPTLDFSSLTLTNPGSQIRGFAAKFDSDGNPLWAELAGSRAFDVDVTADGSAYFTGFYSSTATTVGTNTLTAVSGLDLWIAKFDSAGNVAWLTNSGTSNNDLGRAIVHTSDDSVYTIGEGGNELFDVSPIQSVVFVVKLQSAATGPRASISLTATDLIVSWPADETGYLIETTSELSAAFQQGNVTFTPVPGQTNVYSAPKPASNLFIRLTKPQP